MSKRKSTDCIGPESELKRITPSDDDDRWLYYETIPSLRSMARIKVAICLWYHQDVRNIRKNGKNCINDESEWDHDYEEEWEDFDESDVYEERRKREVVFNLDGYDNKVLEDLYALPVTGDVRETIRELVVPIRKEMDEWVRYQHRRIFFHLMGADVVYINLDELVWKCNGRVDYEQTARNLLTSPRISDVEKYRLMCVYCLVDEMEKKNPLLLSNRFIERTLFDDHPLIYYWNARANNMLNCIASNLDDVYGEMLEAKNVDNERAIEYFWNRISSEKRIEKAKQLIVHHGVKFQAFVLSKLDPIQRRKVFEQIGFQIVLNFARDPYWRKLIVAIWSRIGGAIKEEQFVKTCALLMNQLDADVLVDIWRMAPVDLRRIVVEYEEHRIVNKLLSRPISTCSQLEVVLAFEMLRDASAEVKAQIIRSELGRAFCRTLTINSQFTFFNDFVALCLTTPEEMAQFQRELIQTPGCQKYAMTLLSTANVTMLWRFSVAYLPHPKEAKNYRIELLNSDQGVDLCISWIERDAYDNVNRIVKFAYDDSNAEMEFIMKLMQTSTLVQKFHVWLMEGCIKMNKCFASLKLGPNNIQVVKQRILRLYRGAHLAYAFSRYSDHDWRKFLMWCLGNENNVLQYKLALPIHDIFTRMLEKSTFNKFDPLLSKCKMKSNCEFDELDRFLKWYFVTSQEVKKFKIREAMECDKIRMILTLSKKKDESVLRNVLAWFFEGDGEQIELFKTKFSYCKLSRLV